MRAGLSAFEPRDPVAPTFRCLTAAAAVVLGQSADAQPADPIPTPPPSLGSIWVPEPTRLAELVSDRDAAIALGKSLFWDIRVGSDGQTACATCHGHAGVDPRTLNTVHPGSNGTFDAGVGPGGLKTDAFFPSTRFANPSSRFSPMVRNIDDVVGSQGVLRRAFIELNAQTLEDRCSDVADPVFNDGIGNVRQVTGRNPPTVINAAFNVRQFWDGRANPWFNGVDPFGPTNAQARVWRRNPASNVPEPVTLRLDFAGLASQAVGPANNGVEMSCAGRDWPSLARRLLDARPLRTQRVSPTDSVLGPRAAADGIGLATTYRTLVQQAFRPEWHGATAVPGGLTQIEANFSLFFGIALQLYQATLVSDDSPYDRFADAGFPEDGGGHLDEEAMLGLDLFMNVGQFEDLPITRCADCHATPLFTSATWAGMGVTAAPPPGPAPFVAVGGIERMLSAAGTRAASVTFANHPADGDPSIRPLTFQVSGRSIELIRLEPGSNDPEDGEEILDEDLPLLPGGACGIVRNIVMTPRTGTGSLVAEVRRDPIANGSCGTWLRLTLELFPVGRYAILIHGTRRATLEVQADGAYDMGFYNIGVRPTIEDLGIGGLGHAGTPLSWTRRVQLGLPTPEFDPSVDVPPTVHAAVNGAFKTPTLRNVELTGPYFHNGGSATLRQTIEFYDRGGDFHEANLADLSPQMVRLGLRTHEIDALVAFLRSLTDERVRNESGPFDHPELPLPNGERMPAVGAAGRPAECLVPLRSFEDRIVQQAVEGDCDRDGRLDACMIARDPSLDADGDGTLDACQSGSGDFNHDGAIDGVDMGMLLGAWGICPPSGPCACDLNGDRSVDGIDLGTLLGRWGPVTR
jgi:cytochrome c peroxidase